MPFYVLYLAVMVASCLFAGVIFGGRAFLDGSILAESKETPIVVAAVKDGAVASGTETAAAAAPAFDYASYTADAVKGANLAGKCKSCHTFGSGEANRTGPNLWGIVNAPVGHAAGFAYSQANQDYKATHPTWNDEALFSFLENPRAAMPGTKMQFAGLKKPEERADLIAYLKTLK